MKDALIHSIHLHRIDAARNMRRFYALALQPTLFGDVSMVRTWGRIGTSGQRLIETFNLEEEAARALVRLMTVKKRRGYRSADGDADGQVKPTA
jgi:predicted DNA-binding WGR domain protein